jgi:hypothetical protein
MKNKSQKNHRLAAIRGSKFILGLKCHKSQSLSNKNARIVAFF